MTPTPITLAWIKEELSRAQADDAATIPGPTWVAVLELAAKQLLSEADGDTPEQIAPDIGTPTKTFLD